MKANSMKKHTIILYGDGILHLDCPDSGESIDLSFVTADAGDILVGKVGADTNGDPVIGTIAMVIPTLSGNKFSIEKGYVDEAKEFLVPEAKAPTVSKNEVTIYPGYQPEQAIVGITKATAELAGNVVTVPAGYHEVQTLTVPEAKAPTVDGSTVTIYPGYVPEESVLETSVGGGWGIYQIKSYIPPESIVESYRFQLDETFGVSADEINGVYVKKTKQGYCDRYVNYEKMKVLICLGNIDDILHEATMDDLDHALYYAIIDYNDTDTYDFDTLNDKRFTASGAHPDRAADAAGGIQWVFMYNVDGNKGNRGVGPGNGNYPMVHEWHPETIIGNKVTEYVGDNAITDGEDVRLGGKQYSVEVGKSYVVQNNMVVGHPCFMPDVRIKLKMSGMEDSDPNSNGIYTQNDFMELSQNSTWNNANGYVVKYDYSMSQWVCVNPSGGMVATGGYGNSPLGSPWYEWWTGAEVSLELYT